MKLTKAKYLTALLSFLLMGSVNGQDDMDIKELIQEYVDNTGSVGAAVGFIENGKTQFFTYGKKDLQTEEQITEDTVFELGSTTKVFTTLALAIRVIQGKIQLDDPAEAFLPNVKIPVVGDKKISLRHLATHTAGLPQLPDNLAPKDPNNPYKDYTVEDLYNYLNLCLLTRVPGSSFEYSNTGSGLLGHILALQSGRSYEELIQKLICDDLGMNNTKVTLSPEMTQNLAQGYHQQQPTQLWDNSTLAGASSLKSTLKDMTTFLAANLGLSQSPLAGILRQCHQMQYKPANNFAVGLGWMMTRSNNSDIIWHNGGTSGFRSYIGINPKTQKGVVILSNSTADWPDELATVLLDPDYKRPQWDKALANDDAYMNKFVGMYDVVIPSNPAISELQVVLFGRQLALSLAGGEVAILYPESNGVFGVKNFPNGKVHVTFDDHGNVVKLQAILEGGNVIWDASPKALVLN